MTQTGVRETLGAVSQHPDCHLHIIVLAGGPTCLSLGDCHEASMRRDALGSGSVSNLSWRLRSESSDGESPIGDCVRCVAPNRTMGKLSGRREKFDQSGIEIVKIGDDSTRPRRVEPVEGFQRFETKLAYAAGGAKDLVAE